MGLSGYMRCMRGYVIWEGLEWVTILFFLIASEYAAATGLPAGKEV